MRYLIYRVFFFFAFCSYFPFLLCKAFFRKNGVRDLFKHLIPERLQLIPKPVLWAHAVSVGEVVALVPVLKAYLKRYNTFHVVVSTVTQTGFCTAKKLIPEAHVVVYPFDFIFSIRRLLGENVPSIVLFSEGDVWPSFLCEMKHRGASLVLINGKLSDKSFKRYLRFRGWAKWLYAHIDYFCVQNAIMKQRFAALGVNDDRIEVTGNTKTDLTLSPASKEEFKHLRKSLGLSEVDKVIVLGSTHYPEETELVKELYTLAEKNTKIIIVPRHPERASLVWLELQKAYEHLKISLGSALHEKWDILVVDQLGVLISLYKIASVAIVCGSFVEAVGGHNIFEAAACGVPTVVGPYMHSQKALFESAFSAGAVIQVDRKHLSAALENLFKQEDEVLELKKRTLLWADSQKGASDRTVECLSQKCLIK